MINKLVQEAYETSRDKGWFDPPPTFLEAVALITTELAEAIEFYREGKEVTDLFLTGNGKPDGIPAELADAIIRIFTISGYYGIDLQAAIIAKMEYNKTRPFRHGGKKI